MVLLKVDKISKAFGKKQVLDQIELVVNEGEVVGLVGHNGSGKTMLLRAIIASMRLDNGQVFLKDLPIVFNQPLPLDVGVIIENPEFIPHFTGLENLKYLASINDNYQEEWVLSLLKDLDMYQHKDDKVSNYSLGMRQKLAIVQALMENQSLILLDEPTNGLDRDSVKVVIDLINKIKTSGKGFLIASHDEQLIQSVSDHVYEIADGRIVGGQR